MSQTERSRLLENYQEVTERLMELFVQADKFVDLDAMNACLAERDELVLRMQELDDNGLPMQEAEREQARVIQALDEQVAAAMRTTMQATQRDLVQLRTRRQGMSHYRDEYSVDAYFIDRKK